MLSIVTISYRDTDGIVRTIESVRRQNVYASIGDRFEHVMIVSGLSEAECDRLASNYGGKGVKFAFNSDNGLYNAMNLGMKLADGQHLLFLNGGDEFFNEASLATILGNVSPGIISMFRVAQVYNDYRFLRPGLSSTKKRYSHQGFVAPSGASTPRYNERIEINADTFWMAECMAAYPHKEHEEVVAEFKLGGVSNKPTQRTIRLRLKTNGATSALKESIKYLLYQVMGAEQYYVYMSNRAGYDKG